MNPTVIRDICGTPRGFRAHEYRKEQRCEPCRKAKNAHALNWRTNKTEPRMTPAETAAEVEHLLKLRQGQHYILKALGNPTPNSLERKLHRAGRSDLIPQLFRMEQQAA